LQSVNYQDCDEAEYVGCLGERAVAKGFGVRYDAVRTYGDNRYDLRIGALRIEVKASARVQPRLFVELDSPTMCDVFVLVAGIDATQREGQNVRLAGWVARSAAMHHSNLTDFTWSKGRKYVVPSDQLNPFETLLEDAHHEAE
jgi:hypothetical protein